MWFGQQNYADAQGHGRIGDKPFGTDQPIELLIGDEALEKRSQYSLVIDLGQAWWDITRLPFVFAVWQSRAPVSPALKAKIIKASELAEMRMKLEPSVYFPEIMPLDASGRQLPLGDYWKLIDYRLGFEEIRGLVAFLYLAKHFRPVERSDQILLKMIRLQELSSRMNSI
jgi:chorismate dehydratase